MMFVLFYVTRLIVGLFLGYLTFSVANSKFEAGQSASLIYGAVVCWVCIGSGMLIWILIGAVLATLLKLDF